MKLKNTSAFKTKQIREIINFVKPSGVTNFDIWIKKSNNNKYYGRCYTEGCAFSGHFNPYIVIRIRPKLKYPLHSKVGKGYIGITLYSQEETLVMLLAHELRHLWQRKHRKGYRVWGARGRYSEKDADAYALHKLREWRRK